MTFLVALALGIGILVTPLPHASAQPMPTVTDVCGVEPSGAAMPHWVDWSKCVDKFRQGQQEQQKAQQPCGPMPSGATVPDERKWLMCIKTLDPRQYGQLVKQCNTPGSVPMDVWQACTQLRVLALQQAEQELRQQQQAEAERRRQMVLEERRVRALEEAAQAQREQAETARRPRTCKTVGYERGRPIVECYYPNIPATR
jgi:hypothetical protein